jgi:hypothetical protein
MTFQALPVDIQKKFSKAAERNLIAAEVLAIRNENLSSLTWKVLRIFELNLREFLHELLTIKTGDSKWWNNQRYIYSEHLLRAPKSENPYQVINLGFLCLLFSDRYHNVLWVSYFSKALPSWEWSRREFHRELKTLVEVRNRIAHHEIIYNYPLIELGNFAQQVMLDINIEAAKTIQLMDFAEKITKIRLGSGGGI